MDYQVGKLLETIVEQNTYILKYLQVIAENTKPRTPKELEQEKKKQEQKEKEKKLSEEFGLDDDDEEL
jgi:hypothetical protein